MKKLFLVLFITAAGMAAPAFGQIVLTVDNDGWQEATWGTPAAVATAGNDYVVDGSNAANNTRVETAAFAGDSLSLINGGEAGFKSSGSANWILDGGILKHVQLNGTYAIEGTVDVQGASTINTNNGIFSLDATLSGSAGLAFANGTSTTGPRGMILNGGGSYSGTMDFQFSSGLYFVRFGNSYTNATVPSSGSGTYDLLNDVSFAGFSWDGITLNPGTYNATDLTTAGITSFIDNGGTSR